MLDAGMKVSQGSLSFAKRIESIGRPPIVVLPEMAARVKAEGQAVIDLATGEPDFDTPQFVGRGAERAMEAGFTQYATGRAVEELTQGIAQELKRENGLRYDPDQRIVVTLGGKQAVFPTNLSTLGEGDELLILGPAWLCYGTCIRPAGSSTVHAPLSASDNFLTTLAFWSLTYRSGLG